MSDAAPAAPRAGADASAPAARIARAALRRMARAAVRAAAGATLAAVAAVAGAQAPDGAALYAKHCASCHQTDAAGTVGLAPALKGGHWTRLGADRGYLAAAIVHGLSGAIRVGDQTFVGSMPSFAAQLDDAAIAAVATHVRGLQGAAGEAPISADEVAAVRKAGGSPPATRQKRAQLLGG